MNVTAESWWEFAACRGQDAAYFFAPSYFEKRAEKTAREAVAKAICARCSVREECLEYAIERPALLGVWAATKPAQRADIRIARLSRALA